MKNIKSHKNKLKQVTRIKGDKRHSALISVKSQWKEDIWILQQTKQTFKRIHSS